MQLHRFDHADLLTQHLLMQLIQILSDALEKRNQAYLVVSGGRTPVDLFQALAKAELPWEKITITLADERCVPLDDPARNEALVRACLLQNKAAKAQFISLYHDETSDLTDTLAEIAALPRFDAVILGMGEDGHTASLFPCADAITMALDEQADAVLRLQPKTAPHPRISLSKARLMNSRHHFVHLLGEKKLTVLQEAIACSDPKKMPISAFLNQTDKPTQVLYAP